jgi:fused signal recognition particle receptor
MFNIFKRDQKTSENQSVTVAKEEISPSKAGLFSRLRQGLTRTRQGFTEGIATLVKGKKIIDAELLEALETQLLLADVGVETTQKIIHDLTARLKRNELKDADVLLAALQEELRLLLNPYEQTLVIDQANAPTVILFVGVNGAGKTTTIGKLAKQLTSQNKKVILAAGDTFRAAAVDQLQVWGERNNIPVIAQATGADSAALIFDALQAAQARGMDVLIADTAGRLHTKDNLMEELKKIKRVLTKLDPKAPHEIILVLDATTGQNALIQAQQFHQAIGVTGVAITKLDGTAKGGIIFAIANQLKLPIRFIGVGEAIDDLRPFHADEFVHALLDIDAN